MIDEMNGKIFAVNNYFSRTAFGSVTSSWQLLRRAVC